MKKVDLSLGGIREMLSRDQMKMIIGGYGDATTCTLNGGSAGTGTVRNEPGTSCAQQSANANDACVRAIQQGYFQTCHYDCACDGQG